MKAHTTEGESEAMQIGRDDYKMWQNWNVDSGQMLPNPSCPFPQGSEDAEQWLAGWQAEADGKIKEP